MSHYYGLHFILVSALLFPIEGLADEWQLKKDEEGIQVYTRSVEGFSYKAIRAEVQLQQTRLSSVVALIRNSPECPQWSATCSSATIIEWVSELENFVHTVSELPWPVKDRELVSHVIWSQDPQSLIVTMRGNAVEGKLQASQGNVRITDARIGWEVISLADGSARVTFTAHIDPTSILPGWVSNFLLVDSPFKTLQGLRERVKLEKYRQIDLDYIVEPAFVNVK
jgi:hypothetical protein